jgi:organic hydroperoxide reductase OsmC/OhrA
VITIKYEKDIERAGRIIQKAEANCLISNSIKSKVILKPEIKL